MNTSLDLNRLIFDPAGADGYGGFDSNTIGSYVIDGYGNQITSTSLVGGAVQALDVKAFTSDGYGNLISSLNGSLNVNLTTASGNPYDTNYGVVGVDTLRTASQIGNATGAADFNAGPTTAQTLRVTSNLSDGYGNAISSSGGALNVNIANSAATSYAEDSPHTSGDMGSFSLGVRNDNDAVLTSADFDYSPFAVDAYGRIKTVTSVTIDPSDAEFLEGSAHLFNDTLLHVGTVVKTDSTILPYGDGSYSSFFVDGYGNLKVVASFDPSLVSNNHLQVVLDTVADDAPDAYNPIKVGSRAVTGPLAQISAANDRADLISDLYRRIYINDSCNIGLQSSNPGALVAATALQVAASPLLGRRRMIVQNNAAGSIFLGNASVTTAAGLEIRAGQSMNLDIGPDVAVYIISVNAVPSGKIRVFELA